MTMERRVRRNFLCDAINAGLFGAYIGITGPFTLALAVRLGASSLEVGLLAAAPFAVNLLSPLWARLSATARKVPWVVIPHAIWRGGMGLIGFIKNPALFTGMFVATNAAVAASNPAYGALIQKIYPAPIRGRLMGYARLAMAAIMLPTTLIAGRLLDRYGPAWLYLAAGLIALTGIGIFGLIREPEGPASPAGAPTPAPTPVPARAATPGALAGLKLAFSDPAFRRFLVAAVVFHGGVLMASPLYAVYQVRRMGLSNVQISYLSIAWNVAWLAAFAFWGRVVDRKGPRPVVIGAAAFYLGMPLAYALGGGTYVLAVAGALCQGVADAAMDLGGWNLILTKGPERVGPYTAAAMTAAGVRGALGPLLGSWLLSGVGFEATFVTSAALVLVGLLLFVSGREVRRAATAVAS
jgi:MFS family permease